MNRTILVGRLTKDPDLRYTPSGHAVANFNIAVNRPFKNEQGEQEADFIQCVTWRKQAENLANYMKKGNRIGVDGRIQTRSYDNDQGQRVYVTEVLAESITFLESRKESQGNQSQPNNAQNQPANNPFGNEGQRVEIQDSDLPF